MTEKEQPQRPTEFDAHESSQDFIAVPAIVPGEPVQPHHIYGQIPIRAPQDKLLSQLPQPEKEENSTPPGNVPSSPPENPLRRLGKSRSAQGLLLSVALLGVPALTAEAHAGARTEGSVPSDVTHTSPDVSSFITAHPGKADKQAVLALAQVRRKSRKAKVFEIATKAGDFVLGFAPGKKKNSEIISQPKLQGTENASWQHPRPGEYRLQVRTDSHPLIDLVATATIDKVTFHNDKGRKVTAYTNQVATTPSFGSTLEAEYALTPPVADVTATPTPTATLSPTPEATPYPTRIVNLTPTAIPTGQACFAETLEWNATESLEQRLKDWTSGALHIAEPDRFTTTGHNNLLGIENTYTREDPNKTSDTSLLGMPLGTKVVDNHLIVYMGFEDTRCNQYFVPFNADAMNDPFPNFAQIFPSRELAGSFTAPFDRLTVPQFQTRVNELAVKHVPVELIMYISNTGFTPSNPQQQDIFNKIIPQEQVAQQLNTLIYNLTVNSTLSQETLPKIINSDPQSFDPSALPLLRQVGYNSQLLPNP